MEANPYLPPVDHRHDCPPGGAGQTLPDGRFTRRVPLKGFRSTLILLYQAWLGAIDVIEADSRQGPEYEVVMRIALA
jgi:hypothetical protein